MPQTLLDLLNLMPKDSDANNGLLSMLAKGPQTPDYTPSPFDYGYRYGTANDRKGLGYFGEIPNKSGGYSTELSIGVDFGNGDQEIPLLVPSLTKYEVDHLVSGGKPTSTIVQKAVQHAMYRISIGRSPFASYGEQQSMPKW